MIAQIVEALQVAEVGKNELIDIAKGRYELPKNFKDIIKHGKKSWLKR